MNSVYSGILSFIELLKMATVDSYNAKLLTRTIPFDSDRAILFIKSKGEDVSGTGKTAVDHQTKHNDFSTTMSGEEVSKFYEEVVKSVHDPPKVTTRKERNVRKRKEQLKKPDPAPSVDELFKLVQEGKLNELENVLSTGNYDINTKDGFDWSLLMCASCAGHVSIVDYLLDNGAKWMGVTDRRGFDAPTLAEKAGHYDISDKIRTFRPKIVPEDDVVTCRNQEDIDNFYCDICKVDTSSNYTDHSASTLHQFSCQHKPNLLPYSLSITNKGFQMMLANGWNPSTGLGRDGQGRQYPVKTVLKQDRYGLGTHLKRPLRSRVTHFRSGDTNAVKNRRWRYIETKCRTKKDREKLLQKERGWEINMRQYMNSDY